MSMRSADARQGVALDVDNILAREREKRTRPGEVLVDVVDGSVLRASDSQRAKAPHAQRANAQSDDMDMGQNGTSPAWVLRFATRYIAKVESGVRGANGRIQLFRAARHLASIVDDPRYPLTMADAWTLLAAFNERCVPPESDKQKLRDHFDRAFRGLKQPTKIGSRRR